MLQHSGGHSIYQIASSENGIPPKTKKNMMVYILFICLRLLRLLVGVAAAAVTGQLLSILVAKEEFIV